jgi:hypothetical protein
MQQATETAVISTAGLSDDLRGLLTQACETSGLVPRFQDLGQGLDASTNPALFVAVLPAGQRNVTREVAGLVAGERTDTPVMLVCEEPLVGNVVSLCDGRLTLIGAPVSPRTLHSRMRIALRNAARPSAVLDRAAGDAGQTLCVREQRGAACWFASIASNDDAACAWTASHDASRVAVRPNGSDHDVVAFDGTTRTWNLRAHEILHGAWLISSRRFPTVSSLIDASARSIGAASGDLVVAVLARNGRAPSGERWEPRSAFFDAADHGGPELLEFLSRELARPSAALDAVLLEVR